MLEVRYLWLNEWVQLRRTAMRADVKMAIDQRIAAHLDVCRNSDRQSNHLAYKAWMDFHSLGCSDEERTEAEQRYRKQLLDVG